MKTDKILKVALLSLIINFVYSIYNAYLGLTSQSWWFITLSLYYIVLSVTRFALLQIKRKANGNLSTELFAKRFTGIMLIVLSVTLMGTAIISAFRDTGTKHHEIVMITIALYSFTKVTLAIINLVKSKGDDSPVIKTLRNISFADAFVSIFSLQRSMLVSFPGMAENDIRIFNILTGLGVCILVFLLGLNLLGGRIINMAKSKIVKANEKIAEAVVGGYKKIETAVVDGYTKIEDKFVEAYLTHDGETVEEAKERLKKQNKQ